ncbi:probable pseudouridine-5'-phosphatase isoform X2 [Hermetia illucens]|uniref:probable pseudouridine-5'-phosphatase isoform X2 n=1 Tax=Hermetia illucens TaxID=343691 RepID=UPI0018CC5E75|nr:probable pseudouridine-5'-phosphatase isoform X2 [Hermetia illucens]
MSQIVSTSAKLLSSSVRKMGVRKVTHVIFDMDGLLLDTEPIYEGMVRQIAAIYGKPYPYDVRMRIMGTTEQLTAKIAVTELNLPISVEQFLDKFTELSLVNLGKADLHPGAARLVTHLKNHNIPICLATSSGEDMVKIKTARHMDVFTQFHHKVCGSTDPEVKFGKPAPDIFLVAASRFGDKPQPEDCLVFEDAPNGVKAARAAGMQVVMVPDSRVPQEMREGATQVLNSLEEFKPEDFGLPAF